MRTVDEATLQRVLIAKYEETQSYRAVDRHFGLTEGRTYSVLRAGSPVSETIAKALGYRKAMPGRRSGASRPAKFVRLDTHTDAPLLPTEDK